ncbi:MAG: ferritin family protein, partial [Dehalococcoidales bacterium]|nr:ferritin family protein [Dehalococcoidales bacterium]
MERIEAVLSGLELALKMEADGKKYYLQAAKESSTEAGRKLFASLAEEEDDHARRFVEIYNHLKEKNAWPDGLKKSTPSHKIRTIFAEALEEMKDEGIKYETEMKAVE